jgi:hypothetical protein
VELAKRGRASRPFLSALEPAAPTALAGETEDAPMSEPAKVFEDRVTPGQWRVEWFDDDGRCELEIFTGPDARRQALRYAMHRYGHFKEVQPEPQRA